MGNIPTKTTDSDSQLLENKQSELSHKVWKLETSNPTVKLGADGTIPSGIEKVIKNQMKKNQVYSSNFGQNRDERRLLIKIGDDIFYLDSFKMGTVPLVESSDSDMLEGFAGSYYLNRANQTGEDSVITYTTPNSFSGRTFNNIYFNYNVADLEFINCAFYGVCYIKNTGGTVTYTGTNIGGYVISNKPIPITIIGVGDVPDTNF